METRGQPVKKLPLTVQLAAAYLVLIGAGRLIGVLYAFFHNAATAADGNPELAVSLALKCGAAVLILFAGMALMQRRRGSRRFALGALLLIAWFGVKRGALLWLLEASVLTMVSTVGVLLVMTAVMFLLLLKRSAVEALP